jgi:hypothetical protein
MRKHFPLLLILLAVGLGYWLVAGSDEERALDFETDMEGDLTVPPPRQVHLEMTPAAMAAASKRKKEAGKTWQPTDPRKLPKGVLILQPIGPDGKPLAIPTLRLFATPHGQRNDKLATRYDEKTGAWRFERVIAGPVHVRIFGDHIVGRTLKATVIANTETVQEVPLELAGAVKYDVITYAKTRPKRVRMELFDAHNRPTSGYFQERMLYRSNTAREAKQVEVGPEGVVFGLRPGRYRLKVTNLESEEWDEAELQVKAGTTAPVTLEVRR